MQAFDPPQVRTDAQRHQLSTFLKHCRGRLSPVQVGLPTTGNRRTPGLRRQELAALAGVSVSWYTWLEQGRAIQVSTELLERISAALRLSDDERTYLFALAQRRPAPSVTPRRDDASVALVRMLDAVGIPALVMTARWDVIVWNDLTRIFRDYGAIAAERRNLLRILLLDDPIHRQNADTYETMARELVSKFRTDYGKAALSFDFDSLIAELAARSPVFNRLWHSQDVLTSIDGVAWYPQLGGMRFEHSSYTPEGSPTLRVVAYVPYDEDSTSKLAEFMAERSPATTHARPAQADESSP